MLTNTQLTTPTKKSFKVIQIIPAAIIITTFVGALYFSGFLSNTTTNDFSGSNETTFADSDKLTPTRNIEGTWKTTFPTDFKIATDYEEFEKLSDVGTEQRTMTWTITPTDNEHNVYVYIEFTSSNRQVTSGSGYIPDISPVMLTGIINGTQLTLTKTNVGPIKQIESVGIFTFTDKFMEGTWHDHWEGVYEQNVYTPTNGLKLMKQ